VIPFKPGDRVFVIDEGLARLRAIMKQVTGEEPSPNHHGTVEEIWDNGNTLLIYFDDGGGAPYPVEDVRHLTEEATV
jgi:hypothetical protein